MPMSLSLYRSFAPCLRKGIRCMSSSGASPLPKDLDPSRLVQGLTREQVESNPEIAEFLLANYAEELELDGVKDKEVEDELLDEESVEQSSYFQKKAKVHYPRNIRPLTTYIRDSQNEEGSIRSRYLRWKGMIPGLLYGSDPNLGIFSHQPESKIFLKTPWHQLQRELDCYHRNFESRVYDLTILEGPDATEGAVHRVIPQNVQRHPVQSTIFCANFCRYHPGRPIKIPVVQINEEESPALKRDGFIVPIQRHVECFVEDKVDIPERLEVECTGLQVKDVIRLDRVIMPEGVRISDRVRKRGNEFIIGVLFGKGSGLEDEEENQEGTGEEATAS